MNIIKLCMAFVLVFFSSLTAMEMVTYVDQKNDYKPYTVNIGEERFYEYLFRFWYCDGSKFYKEEDDLKYEDDSHSIFKSPLHKLRNFANTIFYIFGGISGFPTSRYSCLKMTGNLLSYVYPSAEIEKLYDTKNSGCYFPIMIIPEALKQLQQVYSSVATMAVPSGGKYYHFMSECADLDFYISPDMCKYIYFLNQDWMYASPQFSYFLYNYQRAPVTNMVQRYAQSTQEFIFGDLAQLENTISNAPKTAILNKVKPEESDAGQSRYYRHSHASSKEAHEITIAQICQSLNLTEKQKDVTTDILLLNPQNLKKQHRRLLLLFHPDKVSQTSSSEINSYISLYKTQIVSLAANKQSTEDILNSNDKTQKMNEIFKYIQNCSAQLADYLSKQ